MFILLKYILYFAKLNCKNLICFNEFRLVSYFMSLDCFLDIIKYYKINNYNCIYFSYFIKDFFHSLNSNIYYIIILLYNYLKINYI
jgi:hypothetical protein